MLKEAKGLEYVIEILKVLHHHGGERDSKDIYHLLLNNSKMKVSLSYVQKMLPRMVRASLLDSSDNGYMLNRSLSEITADMILDVCEMPAKDSPLYLLCRHIISSVSLLSATDFCQ